MKSTLEEASQNTNQKIITVKKADSNKENTYAVMNKECLFDAIKELTHNELKVYLYLASNQDGYILALSTKDIAETLNANKRKIQIAVNGLIDKGYIINEFTDSSKNKFIFHGC